MGPPPWIAADRLEEQRRRLPPAVFEQLFEGRWVEGVGDFLDPATVDAAFSLSGPALGGDPEGRHRFVAGLDLGARHDRTAFAVGHQDGDVVVFDRMEAWR